MFEMKMLFYDFSTVSWCYVFCLYHSLIHAAVTWGSASDSILGIRKTIVNQKIYPYESCTLVGEISNQIFIATSAHKHQWYDYVKCPGSIKFSDIRIK